MDIWENDEEKSGEKGGEKSENKSREIALKKNGEMAGKLRECLGRKYWKILRGISCKIPRRTPGRIMGRYNIKNSW